MSDSYNEEDFKIHTDAGLKPAFPMTDEPIKWVGTDAQWRKYFELAGWELSLKEPE